MAKTKKTRKAQSKKRAISLRSNTVRSVNQHCNTSTAKHFDLTLLEEPTFMALMYGGMDCFVEDTVKKAPKFNLLVKRQGVEIGIIYSTEWVAKDPSLGDHTYFFNGSFYHAVWVDTYLGGGFWVNRGFSTMPTDEEIIEFNVLVCSSTIPFLLEEFKSFFLQA